MSDKPRGKKPAEDDRHKKQQIFRRTVILMVLFGVVMFAPLAARLFRIQILEGDFYQEKAANQQTRDVAVSADRGTIYDSEGNILAISATVQNVVISPKDLAAAVENNEELKRAGKKYNPALDLNYIAAGLADLTGLEKEAILKRMERTGSQYEVIYRKMEEKDAEAVRTFISENKLGNGVYLEPDTKRYYPYGSLASHVIGFVGAENNGMYGAELTYNEELSGTGGRVVTAKNGAGTELLSKYENIIDAQDGLDLHLTINATIQSFAEKALEEGIEKYDVQNGGFCIVMDPKTGGILAMASSQGYDLNNPWAIADEKTAETLETMREDPEISDEAYLAALGDAQMEQWRNRCVNDTYEPGSTFKTMVVAAALEEGVVNLHSSYYCTGSKTVAGVPIACSKRTGHGAQDLAKAVQNSCNPAFMDIGASLGAEKFYNYLESFGFLNTTGIDLNGEGGGVVWARKFFQSANGVTSLATASFGQTFKVTPLQLITAACAVANGGYLLQPHVLDYTTDGGGNVVDAFQPNQIRQVVSEATSRTVRSMLEGVVSAKEGTGRNAYQAGFRIGGKTGTSEKTGLGESEDDYIVSFLGLAPADDPRIVVLLAYDTPKPSHPGSSWTAGGTYISGGNMAAPMAGPLMGQILDYLGVEKQYSADELSGADVQVPQTVGSDLDKATGLISRRGLTCRTIGEGDTVTAQVPAAGAVVPGGSQVILYLGSASPEETVKVPDLSGMNPDSARQALSARGLIMKGNGSVQFFTSSTLVAYQNLAPGSEVAPGTVVEVSFAQNVEDFRRN